MKHLKTYQLFEAQSVLTADQEWTLRFVEGSWSYDPATGLVNVEGDGDYKGRMAFDEGSTENFSGVKFGKVTGFFDCSNNKIVDLDGCPQEVAGEFLCGRNQLTSLKGAPKIVGGYFECFSNALTTLEGCPEVVEDFDGSFNELVNLEGGPKKVRGHFACHGNPNMTSLKGAPLEIGGSFECDYFTLLDGQWNTEGWLSVFNLEDEDETTRMARQFILPLLTPEVLNKEIQKDPAGMVMKLKQIWNDEDFKEIRSKLVWPQGYAEEADLVGDLDDVGF